MKKAQVSSQGFTLIELLIVLAIIGILITTALGTRGCGIFGTERANEEMLQYATNSRPDLTSWTKPQCMRVDSDGDGYVGCTISGKNKQEAYEVVYAECAVGLLTLNDGCKLPFAKFRR